MDNERRYSEQEIAAIFKQAAAEDASEEQQGHHGEGLTLDEIERIGAEVGISAEGIARAAAALERKAVVPPPKRFLGIPTSVARVVDLPGPFAEKDWNHLVLTLNDMYHVPGTIQLEGSFRSWSNESVHVSVEPTSTGHRLRMHAQHDVHRALLSASAVLLLMGLFMISLVAAKGDFLTDLDKTLVVSFFSLLGLGGFGTSWFMLPRWREEQQARLDAIAATVLDRATASSEEPPIDAAAPLIELDETLPGEVNERSARPGRRDGTLSLCIAVCLLAGCSPRSSHLSPNNNTLDISNDGHTLVQAGQPFWWIGDTGWALFQQLRREEVDLYLDRRMKQGFTVIQSVVFWYPHGGNIPVGPHNAPNAYGHRPFVGTSDEPDTGRPLIVDGGSADSPNDFWDHADYIVDAVKARGMYLALLPCWGNAYVNNRMEGSRIEFTEEEARSYGAFLGARYRDAPHIIWVMGGDVDPVHFGDKDQRAVYRAMAEGVGRGVSVNKVLRWDTPHPDWDKTFMTFHAVKAPRQSGERGGSSSAWFHDDPWLDVNMMETYAWTDRIYPLVTKDVQKANPTKPTLLGEGAYEDGNYSHECGWITPLTVRRQAYQALFAGAAGVTYGHWAVWPFRGTSCGKTWDQSLDAPGADQVAGTLKRFLSEESVMSYVPDSTLIGSDPGKGELRQVAMTARGRNGALLYFPEIRPTTIDVRRLPFDPGTVRWFDPRTGDRTGGAWTPELIPPSTWEDAVAIIR